VRISSRPDSGVRPSIRSVNVRFAAGRGGGGEGAAAAIGGKQVGVGLLELAEDARFEHLSEVGMDQVGRRGEDRRPDGHSFRVGEFGGEPGPAVGDRLGGGGGRLDGGLPGSGEVETPLR